jgi:hypothetical protein
MPQARSQRQTPARRAAAARTGNAVSERLDELGRRVQRVMHIRLGAVAGARDGLVRNVQRYGRPQSFRRTLEQHQRRGKRLA